MNKVLISRIRKHAADMCLDFTNGLSGFKSISSIYIIS